MVFVFTSVVSFFSVFFWAAEKLNKANERAMSEEKRRIDLV